jgi:hypothetical protein
VRAQLLARSHLSVVLVNEDYSLARLRHGTDIRV